MSHLGSKPDGSSSAGRPASLPASLPLDLVLEGVSVRYAGAATPALTGISLTVRPGEVTALLGPNGAGKSTLLRVAAGLIEPTAGSARVGGRLVDAGARQALARVVAFVPQTEAVAVGFTVSAVVAMGRSPHQGVWMRPTVEDHAIVARSLARCDLAHLADRAVETLSGGEQRRVAIARALAQEPRVLLLDEPAAFLDVGHRLTFHALLKEVVSSDDVACAVAMHDLDAAARFASRVVLMREGRIVASGPPADVMTPQQLRSALAADIGVGVHAPSGERYFLPLSPAR